MYSLKVQQTDRTLGLQPSNEGSATPKGSSDVALGTGWELQALKPERAQVQQVIPEAVLRVQGLEGTREPVVTQMPP